MNGHLDSDHDVPMNGHSDSEDPTGAHRAAIVTEAVSMLEPDGHIQDAPAGQATFFAGSQHDEGKTILIVQSASDENVSLGVQEVDQVLTGLEALALDDDNRGLVAEFAGCKWAFYNSKFSPPGKPSISPLLSGGGLARQQTNHIAIGIGS